MSISSDGKLIASVDSDGYLRLWDTDKMICSSRINNATCKVNFLAIAPNSSKIAVVKEVLVVKFLSIVEVVDFIGEPKFLFNGKSLEK